MELSWHIIFFQFILIHLLCYIMMKNLHFFEGSNQSILITNEEILLRSNNRYIKFFHVYGVK